MFKMLKVRKKKKELYNVSKENNTSRLCFFAKKVKGGGLGEDSEGMEERKMGDLPSKKFM